MRNTSYSRQLALFACVATVALLFGACSDEQEPVSNHFSSGTSGGFGAGGSSRGDVSDSNDSEDFDDPNEGFYEITDAFENREGCAADTAEAVDPPRTHLLVLYEMTADFGPAYTAYWCDSDAEDSCEDTSAFIFPDVEVSDAEELPEAEERAQGALGLLLENTVWDENNWACYATLEETDLSFDNEELSIGLFEHAVRAHEIESPDQCDQIEQVHQNYSEDDFSCEAALFFDAEQVVSFADQ
ncbi:MAG: hypothetical protein ACOCV2_02030 [Persicimonas sp.]